MTGLVDIFNMQAGILADWLQAVKPWLLRVQVVRLERYQRSLVSIVWKAEAKYTGTLWCHTIYTITQLHTHSYVLHFC